MKIRRLISILLAVVVVILAIFAARSIMRPEKFKTVYQLRKEANVQNLLAIRSAQAVYKNVHKVYADDIDKLVDFVNNGTVMIEKNVGNFPDTMSEAEAERGTSLQIGFDTQGNRGGSRHGENS